jgi:hypothetical protein
MSTSGSWDYSVTASAIITMAAENLTIIEAGGTVSSADQTTMLRRLNLIAKQWQGKADMAQGLKIWTRQRLTLFLAKGQQRYTVGPASTDSRATAQYGRTTLSSAYASGTSLSVSAVSDTTTYPGTTVSMTSGDIIGVVLNDGTISWTTLASTPSASPATLSGALAGAAAAGNFVYWFTSRAQRFPICEYASLRIFDTTSFGEATDIPLFVYRDLQSYEALPNKTADSDPTALLIEPQRLNTAITLDCQPNDVTKVVNLAVLYPAEDYDATSDDIAFPQEWYAALEWELTLRCAPLFGGRLPRAAGYFVMGRK